jgi:SAM-dependent methyltransferase
MSLISWKHLYRLVFCKATLVRVLTEIQLERIASEVAWQMTSSDANRGAPRILLAGGTRVRSGSEHVFVKQLEKNFPDMKITVVNISNESAPDVVADLTLPWPFKTSSFDIVISTWVIEHLSEPRRFFFEAYRVLAEGGILVVTTPFIHRLHSSPFDYWRFTDTALMHLAKTAGFRRVKVIRVGGTPFLCVVALLWPFFRIPILGASLALMAVILDYTLVVVTRLSKKGVELVQSLPLSYMLYASKEG